MTGLNSILEEEIENLKTQNLYRELKTLCEVSGPHAILNNREVTLFCGNDYLGLSHHPRVIKAAGRVAETWGVGSGAARLISGTTDHHSLLELKLAEFKEKPKALLFSTGYLANIGVLTALASKEDVIIMDKLCHASIIDGARLSGAQVRVYPHLNYERLEEILKASSEAFRRKIIVTDTVFSMDGDVADLATLVEMKKKHHALLVVDDAHGTGVLGQQGRGALEDPAVGSDVDVVVGTLSKALGCLGGFAAADESIIDYLINVSRPFIFATSLPPMVCAAAQEAISIVEEDSQIRHLLWNNAKQLHQGVSRVGFEVPQLQSPILPIMIGSEKEALRISEELLNRGFLIPAVRTPTVPKGKARLRVTVSAAHQEQEIEKLVDNLKKL